MFIDFLDGYRGVLAYWVFISHVNLHGNLTGDYDYFRKTGYFIAVIGFFLLSSYLLTYRLVEELKKHGDDLIPILLIFLKYFIRRFFRIYIPFAIFVTLCKFVFPTLSGAYSLSKTSWSEFLTLNYGIMTHLWTIPPEIKYYFFIPFFALLTHLLNKNTITKILWIIVLAVALSIIEIFNLFDNKLNEYDRFPLYASCFFLTRFTTFLLGSYLAVIVSFIFDLEIYKNYETFEYFRMLFGSISMIFYVTGMYLFSGYHAQKDSPISLTDRFYFIYSVFWASFLFFFIIGGKNYFTNLFLFKLFTFGGKISFGFYLYHMGVIYFVVENFGKNVRYQFEKVFYSFIGTFAIGFLHYHFVEKNLMKLANFLCIHLEDLDFFKRKLHDMKIYHNFFLLIDKAKKKIFFCC